MSFIDHTHAWLRGEAVDMAVLSVVGVALLVLAIVLWRMVATPLGQALVIPCVLVAVLFLGSGLSGVLSAQTKIDQYSASYESDPDGFVQSEHDRVSGFDRIYAYTLIGAAVGFGLALCIFVLTDHATWRAFGIMFVFLALSALVIDGFSSERAAIYAAEIEKELARPDQ